MRSANPIEWDGRPSRLQSLVVLASVFLALTAVAFWTQWQLPWLVAVGTLVVALEAWRFWQSSRLQSGRFVIQSDGFWRIPESDALWELKAVSWFPGICQCELSEATRTTLRRRFLIWRDQVDSDTWRRLRIRLLPAS